MTRFLIALMLFAVYPAAAETVQVRTFGAVDGDTIIIDEPCNRFDRKFMKVRIFGIDTPESHMPPAKCEAEVILGKKAKAFAQTLIKRGDMVGVTFHSSDKYSCRIDADITLPDGRNFGTVMLNGHARPYGIGKAKDKLNKSDWCK